MIRKLINIPEVGDIVLEKKPRQKTIRLRIHPERGVFVSTPIFVKEKEAIAFAKKHKDWIKSKKSIINEKKSQQLFTETSEFKTRMFTLKFETIHDKIGACSKTDSSQIIITVGRDINFEDSDFQKFIEKVILRALQIEATQYLPQRVSYWASKFGFNYKSLDIGKAGKAWGSCKTDNSLRLSCRLMLLPDELIDFIIIHELCHTKHKNHGYEFKKLLDLCTKGRMYELNKKLKNQGTGICPGNYTYHSDETIKIEN